MVFLGIALFEPKKQRANCGILERCHGKYLKPENWCKFFKTREIRNIGEIKKKRKNEKITTQ